MLSRRRARYYYPQLRRFLNQDTVLGSIGVSASMNRFAYANGNPISGIDPFGLMQVDAPNSGGSEIGNIADNPFGNTARQNCAPTSLRTIITAVTGNDPGIAAIQNQVAAAEGTPSQNWTTTGTSLGVGYANTMTTVLNNNGVQALALPNTDSANPNPNVADVISNVQSAGGPSAVQVSYTDGSGKTYYHTITVQAAGRNLVVTNLTGLGGTTVLPISTFASGQITSEYGTNYTVQPQYPTIAPTGKH
jgi:hypothetical protein